MKRNTAKSSTAGNDALADSMFKPAEEPVADTRACDWPGCGGSGEHRAPRSRGQLDSYRWFCLEHIRQFNKSWNYYEGMSEEEVEADVRKDTTWDRPSWPLGGGEANLRFKRGRPIIDDFGAFGQGDTEDAQAHRARHRPDTLQAHALAVLDLNVPVTPGEIKARYKELVKRHHPDANGGDKAAEEKFKQISEAYTTLMAEMAT